MVSVKGATIAMLVLVIVASIALGSAMRDQNWMMSQKNNNAVNGQGLWARCEVANGYKKNWVACCSSSTEGLKNDQKTMLQTTQVLTTLGSITLLVSLILSIILTCHAKTHGPHSVHVANSVLLGVTMVLLLTAGVVYVLYSDSYNKNKTATGTDQTLPKQPLAGGYVFLVVAFVLSVVAFALCVVAGRKAHGSVSLGALHAMTHPATLTTPDTDSHSSVSSATTSTPPPAKPAKMT